MDDPINNQVDTPLQSVLDLIETTLDGAESVDLKTVVEAFGNRAFGPVMVLCGLCMMTPLGAIPGIPVAPAAIILILGLGITARDGVFILLGLSLSFGVFIGTASLIFQSLPVF